ncbi:MAG: hypothetical protein KGI54_13145 [Pseudomonadota bacterium]|nr:hypothetical protein [Pseudomonadota bacterium]
MNIKYTVRKPDPQNEMEFHGFLDMLRYLSANIVEVNTDSVKLVSTDYGIERWESFGFKPKIEW